MRETTSEKAEQGILTSDSRVEVKRILAGQKAPMHVEPTGFVWSVVPEDGYLIEVSSPHRTVIYISDAQLIAAHDAK